MKRSLENDMKTIVPSPTRPTGTRDNRELPINKKFVWEKVVTEYFKQETNIENCQKPYALVSVQCSNSMRSKIETQKDYHITRKGIRCVSPRGVHQGGGFQVQQAQASTTRPPQF